MARALRPSLAVSLLVWALAAAACSSTASSSAKDAAIAAQDAAGDAKSATPITYPVGHVDFVAVDAARGRTLRMTLWYPADPGAAAAAQTGMPVEDFVPAGADHDTFAALVAKAPAACTSRRTHSAPGAKPASIQAQLPLAVFSHCLNCTRFSSFSIAESLASQGIAVLAPDHTGNTIFDGIAGTSAPLGADFLAVRAADVRFALDLALDPTSTVLPAEWRGRFDATKVGVYGHSFGGVTVGRVLSDDVRFKAGLAIAVPMGFLGVKITNIHVPVAFLLAQEDNSITEAGNILIRQNFADATVPAWLWEVKDTGHFSFSNIADIKEGYEPGCGDGVRQTVDGEKFTYLDNDIARGIAQHYVAAYFRLHLLGDASAAAELETAQPAGTVTVQVR